MKDASIKFKIFSARNLASKDKNGLSDPYCQLRLGKQKHTTKIVPKTLSPTWNAEFIFSISTSDMEAGSIIVTVWDKDLFKSDFLGLYEFKISEILQVDFDQAENSPKWYPLSARKPKEFVSGDVCIQVGVVGHVEKSQQMLTRRMSSYIINEKQHASLISTDDPSDLIFFNHITDVGDDPDEGDLPTDIHGISLGSEEFGVNAKSLPSEASLITLDKELAGVLLIDIMAARSLPYERNAIKSSFNCDPFAVISFGTKTFRTKVKRHTLNPDWLESIYLHLKTSDLKSNWPVSFKIYDFERFSRNNEICAVDCKLNHMLENCTKPIRQKCKPSIYPDNVFEVDLKNRKSKPGENSAVPYLILNCTYIPYAEIRRNFWLAMLNQYDSAPTHEGAEPKIDKVSFVTMLDAIECNFSDETINSMFSSIGKKPTDEITFEQAIEILEAKIKPVQENESSHHILPDFETERMMQIKYCPICKKSFEKRGDFDMISHLALCSHGQLEKIENLAMGGFLTQESASSKWVTKVFSFITFGGMGMGKNNGHILYQDRVTGQLVKEKIPVYIRLGIRLLYQVAGSKSAVESKAIKKLLKNMTLKQGLKFDHPSSIKHISSFAAYHNLDLEEVLDPLESFTTFNEFFYRKLKPEARSLASPTDKSVVVSPADARTLCFPSVKLSQELWIKGSSFTLKTLLGSDELAQVFQDGPLSISRLAPQDYHRFHFPVDGTLRSIEHFEGSYFTVNPMAVRTAVDVYTENARTVCIIDSECHGKVAFVAVGAMLVGSIVITAEIEKPYSRMDELGYFKFGGSTILLIFQKQKIMFDDDLTKNSSTCLETLLKVGNSLAISLLN